MKIRHFPAAVIVTATLALWISFAKPVAAQDSSIATATFSTPLPAQLSGGVEDVLKLSRAKINDDVTVIFVQTGDRSYNLTASEILYLRKEGVSDRVLTAMLNQRSSAPSTLPAPAAADASFASAPQSVTPPTATAFLEAAPASTVYLAATPAYYSFYDPWPYWPSWYAYPYLAFGFYWGWGSWGSCNYGYWNNCYQNNYCQNGYYPPLNGNRPPPPTGNPTPRGSLGASSRPERLVPEGRQPASVNQAPSRGGVDRVEDRSASTMATARPTSVWSNNGNQSAAARPSASQASSVSSRSSQATAPTSLSGGAANNRTPAARPVENRSAAQFTGGSRSSSPASTWSSSASQRPTGPAATGYRPSSQPATRYMASQAPGYQRSSVSPSYSYRASGSIGNVSRPSLSPSTGSMGNASAFRGGGSFSGTGGSRMSSGGGSHGGGGGRSR